MMWHPQTFNIRSLSSLTAFLLLLVGCQRGGPEIPTGQVHGKVTFEGNPVSEGVVTFEDQSQGQLAVAELKSDGTYQVKTSEGGLRAGSYTVKITPAAPQSVSIESLNASTTSGPKDIPEKYRESATSGLTLQVKTGDNSFDIEMTK